MGEIRRRRPWLAVLLALVISGLGHAYLRRWGRALGWYVTITATVVFLVPDSTIDQVFAGTTPPLGEIAPALIVVVASVIDAYVLAVRNNRKYERQQAAYDSAGPASTGPNSVESASGESPSGESPSGESPSAGVSSDVDTDPASIEANHSGAADASGLTDRFGTDRAPSGGESPQPADCPHCGREIDPDLDFCHWCTERLPTAEGPHEE